MFISNRGDSTAERLQGKDVIILATNNNNNTNLFILRIKTQYPNIMEV